MQVHLVYCPGVGYCADNDTGKVYRLAAEAEHRVLELRRAGHYAWCETEGHDHFDA